MPTQKHQWQFAAPTGNSQHTPAAPTGNSQHTPAAPTGHSQHIAASQASTGNSKRPLERQHGAPRLESVVAGIGHLTFRDGIALIRKILSIETHFPAICAPAQARRPAREPRRGVRCFACSDNVRRCSARWRAQRGRRRRSPHQSQRGEVTWRHFLTVSLELRRHAVKIPAT